MAYVLFKVFRKKYTKVRLGLSGIPVTPSNRNAITYDEEGWTTKEENKKKETSEFSRSSDVRQSTAKRMKNILLKKLGRSSSTGKEQKTKESLEQIQATWYLDDKVDDVVNKSEIQEIDDIFETAEVSLNLGDLTTVYQRASVVEVKTRKSTTALESGGNENHGETKNIDASVIDSKINGDIDIPNSNEIVINEDEKLCDSRNVNERVILPDEAVSPILSHDQDEVAGTNIQDENPQNFVEPPEQPGLVTKGKKDLVWLVDEYFGDLYRNYKYTRRVLVRQARDILVCEYQGCLQKFEEDFCTQASRLLKHLQNAGGSRVSSPAGWPLSLGDHGVAVQLCPLEPALVRPRECFLCVRHRSRPGLEVALVWRDQRLNLSTYTLAQFEDATLRNLDNVMVGEGISGVQELELCAYKEERMTDDCEDSLPAMLQNLLITVEQAVERIPLDELSLTCPQCLRYLSLDEESAGSCSCRCPTVYPLQMEVERKDSAIQTSPNFEHEGRIPHIDSDEDEEDKGKGGFSNNRIEIQLPKSIAELPDKLLMSGINLPGTEDHDGRPIILCFSEAITKSGLTKYDIAKLLLYYSSIPNHENKEKGFTILLVTENEDHIRSLGILDKAVCLVAKYLKVSRFLIWRPTLKNSVVKTLASRVQTIVVCEEQSLLKYMTSEQAPAQCSGGTGSHDQLEWVEFFRLYEPFAEKCRTVTRELATTLSQLRKEDQPFSLNRALINHQCRLISRALKLDSLRTLLFDGERTVGSLEERGQWSPGSRDVQRRANDARAGFETVQRVARRLEQLDKDRKERLRELQRARGMKEDAEEFLSWFRSTGQETLNKLILQLRSATSSVSVKEITNDFEKFFFGAWRQVEKSTDLVEECKNIQETKMHDLKELATTLQAKMKTFKEQLEETRVHLEEANRCFLLLESCDDILEDDRKEQAEFVQLAINSGNEKLAQICKISIAAHTLSTKPPDPPVPPEDTDSSILKPCQLRRRSVSSHAYIYHCNHHAAGQQCSCQDSDPEGAVSSRLKRRYLQTLRQTCSCGGRGISTQIKDTQGLNGIEEEQAVEWVGCDSGVSTGENSVGDDQGIYKKKLQRLCSCQYYDENCASCSSSTGSTADNNDNQRDISIENESECYLKSNSNDDEDDHYGRKRKVPPILANSHLYCHSSTLDLPSDALYRNMDPKIQKTLKFIIKEMIETERDYAKSLDYVIVNYIPELTREDIPQALRGQRNVVFGNIEKIYEFHSQQFLNELEECENNPLQVGQIFLKYKNKFYLYALYNKNKPKSDSLMSEYGSAFFKSKQIDLEDKMDLASYLLKPVQRMGKYALLLQQMMKACPVSESPEKNIQEFEDLKHAEEMVRFQLRHGNDLLAMDSIRDCDVNLKEQGRLLRQNEFLVWEGKSGKKSLRQVFLFEDLILFSKAKRLPDRKNLDLYIYRNSIKMTDIGLTAKIGDSPTKFEIWFRKRKPSDTFTLQSMSTEVKRAWTEELSQLLWKQAIKNRAVRMAEMSSMGIGNKPCLDIRPSEDQISDRSITFAQLSRRNTLRRSFIYHPFLNSDSDTDEIPAKPPLRKWQSFRSILGSAAPRFRNSIVSSTMESCRATRRPQSVISMSSVSTSSTSSGGSGSGGARSPNQTLNLSFESNCDKSATLNSQCSTESGILADMSLGSDESSEQMANASFT